MTEKLTSEEREALHNTLLESGCHGFLSDHPELFTTVEAIITAHVAAAVAEARETVAREIEAMPRVPHAEYATAFLATRAQAAAIARSAS